MRVGSLLVAIAGLAASAATVGATVMQVASPSSPAVGEIGARIRWGATGFEASIFDSNPFLQTPTLNPVGTPVWNPVSGAPHNFLIVFDQVTGQLDLSVDFNRDLAFGVGESISQSVFASPGQASYAGYGFSYLSISGNEGGSSGRSTVGNLVINGAAQSSMSPNGLFLENYYQDSAGLLTAVTISGSLDFITAGTGQERPSWNFTFRDSAPVPVSVPDAGSATVLMGAALSAIATLRRALKV